MKKPPNIRNHESQEKYGYLDDWFLTQFPSLAKETEIAQVIGLATIAVGDSIVI